MTTHHRALGARLTTIGLITLLVAACSGSVTTATPQPTSQPSVVPSTASPEPTSAPSSAPPSPSAAAGGWQQAGSMVFPRLGARVALLDTGSVLVVGNEPCVAAGEPTYSEKAEVFDPSTDTWAEIPSLNKQRDGSALVALQDGTGMVLGGSNAQGEPFSSTKIYRPTTHAWSDGPLMLRAGATSAVTFFDGRVLAVGPGRAEILDPGAPAWRRVAAPPSSVAIERMVVAGRWVVAIGATDEGAPTFLRFDGSAERWKPITDSALFRPVPIALQNDALLVIGDDEGGSHVQRYDPATDRWSEAAQMAQGRTRAQVTMLSDGRVLVAGGVELKSAAVDGGYAVTEGAPLASTEIYDPATNMWSPGPSLRGPRQGGQAITFGDGSVLVFGGYVESPPPDTSPDTGTPGTCPTPLATTERLRPAS
jgi:hypothetical protein